MEKQIERKKISQPFNVGYAYWNQRSTLHHLKGLFQRLIQTINHSGDLFLSQWAQIAAAALEFQPDVILELGRGKGNSTCAFTAVANQLGKKCSVASLCFSDDWDREVRQQVEQVVPAGWFKPLTAHKHDILTFDYESLLKPAKRILVFWDAHGFEIAECVLGKILPLIAEHEHLVIMHDLSDASYGAEEQNYYGNRPLWKGNNWDGPRLRIGPIDTAVEQGVAIVDFTTRNRIGLYSADKSIREEIGNDTKKYEEMTQLLGTDMFSLSAHWFYFSLNERSGVFTFPHFEIKQTEKPALPQIEHASLGRLKKIRGKISSFLRKTFSVHP